MRAIGNIVYVRGIWLDFEVGDLKPDEFPDLFPDTRMAIFNTYNHTTDAPRLRVVIPTKDIMTPEAYSLIWEQIEFKLKDAGYSVGSKSRKLKRSGLDKSKKTPTSLFFLPCQAKNPRDSFFWDFKDDRATLDPFNGSRIASLFPNLSKSKVLCSRNRIVRRIKLASTLR